MRLFPSDSDSFSGGFDQKCQPSILLRRRAKSYDEAYFEGLSEIVKEPDRWSTKAHGAGDARQILAKIFHSAPLMRRR
jgi:hypothetical protein